MSLTTHLGYGPFQLGEFIAGELFARYDGSLAMVCDPQPIGRMRYRLRRAPADASHHRGREQRERAHPPGPGHGARLGCRSGSSERAAAPICTDGRAMRSAS